MGIGVIFPG